MEREGSGFDLMYERLLASGRGVPVASEGTDSVHVVVPRRVIQPAVIRLLADANDRYQLTQRERIVFGLLAQTEGLSAVELAERLELADPSALRPWFGTGRDTAIYHRGRAPRGSANWPGPASRGTHRLLGRLLRYHMPRRRGAPPRQSHQALGILRQ